MGQCVQPVLFAYIADAYMQIKKTTNVVHYNHVHYNHVIVNTLRNTFFTEMDKSVD